ncbi:hypothetical protein [Actinomadura monticuli]|uniref:Translation initiation factor IF-2 n=1 Tax=Actinomadura monticuli TaxID=3097367 RepID=A0ABV4Q497_9ACTN
MSDQREVIDSRDRHSAPIFVDVTGRRRRRMRRLGYAAAALCGSYAITIALSLAGGPVSPRTLLPKVIGGDGETKVVPSEKHRPPTIDDGPVGLPLPRPLPRPTAPFRLPAAPAPSGPAASGSAPSGAVPSSPAPGERRSRPRNPAEAPPATPGGPGAAPPEAPPTTPETTPASPPAAEEPAANDGERSTGGGSDAAIGAEPQGTAAAPLTTESGPSAAGAGDRE